MNEPFSSHGRFQRPPSPPTSCPCDAVLAPQAPDFQPCSCWCELKNTITAGEFVTARAHLKSTHAMSVIVKQRAAGYHIHGWLEIHPGITRLVRRVGYARAVIRSPAHEMTEDGVQLRHQVDDYEGW